MEDKKYVLDYESVQEDNPQLDTAWEEIIAPSVTGSDRSVYTFIMSYIFM
ncbi:hypothetical protein LJB76_00760 [Clostridia bacterium OttesenSCG-928-O13]|nr:hypothetical protein [Clostridia bacterium OttesenSCG-928-O13]